MGTRSSGKPRPPKFTSLIRDVGGGPWQCGLEEARSEGQMRKEEPFAATPHQPAAGAHKGLGAGPPATGGSWQGFNEMVALGLGVPLAARGSPLEAHPFLLLVVCFFLPGLAVDLEPPKAPAPFKV